MLLLTGPAGSGKTLYILEFFREALRAGNDSIRLLAPTATLAQHLQNRLAREGFVFRGSLIQTLSGFVRSWAGPEPEVPHAVLYLIVEEAARRLRRPEFASVVQLPGFCASLARTIGEFSSAGCDSARLAKCLPDAPLAAAFLAVYKEVDRELAGRGLAMRATRLERAARRIEREGLNGIATIWLDGFHSLPDPELQVIAALGRHAEVTLALADADLSGPVLHRLEAIGFHARSTSRVRSRPATNLVSAPNIERETEEIVRRIVEQADAGRPFHEIAIIVRAAETYVPMLRSTLERFGIPARFYFECELRQHAVMRFLTGAVDAMLSGWDHALTLAVLRLAPRLADSNAMDRFEFKVREQIPNLGLGALQALLARDEDSPDTTEIKGQIEALAALEEWRCLSLLPKDWAGRFRALRSLFRPARPREAADAQFVLQYRSQAAVLDLFDECVEEAAQAFNPAHEIALEAWWRDVKSVLRLKPLDTGRHSLADGRRNVVHVISAEEARQWVAPVVFVCGMVEKQFPRFHPQNPFFPDDARARLNAAGVRVRTAAEFEREERALWESAATRATMLVTFSYPEFDARGERNLPSLFLEDFILVREDARPVRPAPRRPAAACQPAAARQHAAAGQPAPPRAPVEIRAPGLLDFIHGKTARQGPTALEMYLQCPFQYFSLRTMRLKGAPLRPVERLDFITQGNIVHQVLAEWWGNPQDITALFERVFAQQIETKRIPGGYHTERLRNEILEDLKAFVRDDVWPRSGFQSRMEEAFEVPLDESLAITGKIDRLDTDPQGNAYVIDYKYSNTARVKDKLKNEALLQAPLYLMAAQHQYGVKPAGMFYVGLKAGIEYAGWSEPGLPAADAVESLALPRNWLESASQRALKVVREIRAGRVEPIPANPGECRFCNARDICRIETGAQDSGRDSGRRDLAANPSEF